MLRHALLRRQHAALAKRQLPGPLADYLAVQLPNPRAPWREVDFLALDVETTGLDATTDRILSVGWVLVSGGQVRLSTAQSLLVRPDTQVGQSATVHGLTDAQVRDGHGVEFAMSSILTALAGRVLLVHYAALDKGMIDRLCLELYGAAAPMVVADTMQIELRRRRRQQHTDSQKSLRLGDLRDAYGLPYYAAHNCLTDAIATAELFLAMAAAARDSKLTLGDLL